MLYGMLLAFYRLVFRGLGPLLGVYLKRRLRRGKEEEGRLPERRGEASRARGEAPLVWCHAASVGESLSLLSIVQKISELYPAFQILVTTGTVTSARLMRQRLPANALHQYMPLDHPAWVEKFLNHWRPGLVIWSESELWPNMLLGVKKRSIHGALLNARMSEKSFRRWSLAKGTAGEVLSVFNLCLAQNSAEAGRLSALGARDVRIAVPLKYAADPLPHDAEKLLALKKKCGTRKTILWASTHPGEEDIALDTHRKLVAFFPGFLTIIVPRHPERGTDIELLAQKRSLATTRRGNGGEIKEKTDIYIADTLGELGIFYRLCKNVVMGGSFADIGGHNPIEPARLGCLIFFGPSSHNFSSILEDFRAAGAVVEIADNLTEKLKDALEQPERYAQVAENARRLAEEKAKAADSLIDTLGPFLEKLAGRGS